MIGDALGEGFREAEDAGELGPDGAGGVEQTARGLMVGGRRLDRAGDGGELGRLLRRRRGLSRRCGLWRQRGDQDRADGGRRQIRRQVDAAEREAEGAARAALRDERERRILDRFARGGGGRDRRQIRFVRPERKSGGGGKSVLRGG
ncbi:MAG: hypothetical protein AAFW46_01790, partial [Pseudomonadota bacterium]